MDFFRKTGEQVDIQNIHEKTIDFIVNICYHSICETFTFG